MACVVSESSSADVEVSMDVKSQFISPLIQFINFFSSQIFDEFVFFFGENHIYKLKICQLNS